MIFHTDNYVNTFGYLEFLLLEKYIEHKMKLDKDTIILLLKTNKRDELVEKLNKCVKLSDVKNKFFIQEKAVMSDEPHPQEIINMITKERITVLVKKSYKVKHYFFDHVSIVNSSARVFLDYIDKFEKQLI